ncbi:MAG: hypothetical protein NVSMB52_15160 [Chloroflexota bacterium]
MTAVRDHASPTERNTTFPVASTTRSRAYFESRAAQKLRTAMTMGKQPRLACLDIDSTLTGRSSTTNAVREMLESAGYVVMFDTSRTEEMILTSAAYGIAKNGGQLQRPPPHLLRGSHGQEYVPPEEVIPRGVLDADIVAGSTGTRILVQQSSTTYDVDTQYEASYDEASRNWRAGCLQLLSRLRDRGSAFELSAIDIEENYRAGTSDVFPPTYRIQLNFRTVDEKLHFRRCLSDLLRADVHGTRTGHSLGSNVRATDDSKPDADAYKVFVTPRRGSKFHAVERVIDQLVQVTGVRRQSLHVLFAGDSYPDLSMGLLGGIGTSATFLIVGGSRLVPCLTDDTVNTFAGESVRTVRKRLTRTHRRGWYTFMHPVWGKQERTVLLGDFAFPGTEAVETVYEYLRAAPH